MNAPDSIRSDRVEKKRRFAPVWVWLPASATLHVGLYFLVLLVAVLMDLRGCGHTAGPGEVPIDLRLTGATTGTYEQAEVVPAGTDDAPTAAEPEVAPAPVAAPPVRHRPRRQEPEEHGTLAPPPEEAPVATGQTENQAEPGGHNGDADRLILGSAGMLGNGAATDALGGGGFCPDSVVGTWRAQKYRGEERSWVRFTLHVEREGDRLRGTIISRIWTGPPGRATPGECSAFGSDHTWEMQAEGHLDGERMTFDGHTLHMTREDCPSAGTSYAIDHFSGTLRGESLRALNNDGAYDVDEPYTFRRVACE